MVADRLLLIDDHPEIGAFVAKVARQCGFEVRTTAQADEFEASYRAFQPTLIAIDLAMPETDGIELLRRLADTGCTVPILIISGFDQRVVEAAQRLGGAYGLTMGPIVRKPMRVAELTALFAQYRQTA